MPKLAKAAAKRTEKAESSSFDALPEGPYRVKLTDVDGSREGKAGPYWSWELTVVEPDEFEGRKLWVNTSLSEKADWKMKETFHAFGYTCDSDTDEIIGEECKAIVSQRPIEGGARNGQIGNNVDNLLPLGDADGDDGDDDDDEVF